MDNEIVEEVTEWESEQFSGGYDGLRELAEREFTGAVTNDFVWLFFLNGRIVAAVDGSIESFAEASGTAYRAPHPSVPLLFAMQEQGGDTKAKYYTEETPLSEVDETLSSGNFTGYVELSENVLSGDYYLVYHGGRSLACAFIGNNRSLLTGEEAFERTADEVGIYEVRDVDIDVISIPEQAGAGGVAGSADVSEDENTENGPASDDIDDQDDESVADDPTAASGRTTDAPTTAGATDERGSDASDLEGIGGIGEVVDSATESDEVGTAAEAASDPDDVAEEPDDDSDPIDAPPVDVDSAETTDTDRSTDVAAGSSADVATGGEDDVATDDSEPDAAGRTDDQVDSIDREDDDQQDVEQSDVRSSSEIDTTPNEIATSSSETDESPSAPGNDGGREAEFAADDVEEAVAASESTNSEDPFSKEAQWRETQSIPSLDPSNSRVRREAVAEGEPETTSQKEPRETERSPARSTPDTAATTSTEAASVQLDEDELAQLRERHRDLEAALEEAEAAKERLAAEREELEAERDQYRERAQQLESRVDELEAEIDQLESTLAETRERDDGQETRTMPSSDALAGTNLFVRYDTKGGATLEKAHAGDIQQEEVVQNLRLEHHTSFDTDGLRVAGDPFEEFLRGTVEYRFVRWVVEDLLSEIRQTGHETALTELFDAIPDIDRAELYGTVSVEYQQNGDTHREQEQFDVVLRDRMGNPLLVANLNADRDPATGDMMTSLIETARRVKDTSDTLGAAFLVTTSYFEPGALETADEATGGGLLGRGKRKSFVKLSRKQGFHLCLVETRDGNFHVNVPEL